MPPTSNQYELERDREREREKERMSEGTAEASNSRRHSVRLVPLFKVDVDVDDVWTVHVAT